MIPQKNLSQKVTTMAKQPQRKKIPIIMAVGGLTLTIIGFFAWQGLNKPNADNAKNMVKVKQGPADIYVLATGIIRPDRDVKISPKQAGLLKTLLVKQGDVVQEGQLIALMDDSNLLGDIASARGAYLASLDNYEKMRSGNRPQEVATAKFQELKAKSAERQASQNVSRLEAQIKALTFQLQRDETFAERQQFLSKQGAVSDQAGIDAQTAASVTRSQLEAARKEKAQAEDALAQAHDDLNGIAQQRSLMQAGYRAEDIAAAKHNAEQARGQLLRVESLLNDTRIRAPFSGIITQKFTDAGAIVTPTTSSATTSATSSSIVSLAGKLEMVAQVSESNIPKITIGQPVEITATAYPNKIFHGKVTQIAPAAIVTQNVTTFEVHAEPVDDSKQELLAGMNVGAKFIVGRMNDAMTVPTVCVVSRKGQAGVFVPDDKGEPVFKPVKTGPTVGRDIVILSGLQPNEKIFQGLSREQLTKQGYGSGGMGGGGQQGPSSMFRMGGGGRGGRGGGGMGR
jgi:HlyD family secretion protein